MEDKNNPPKKTIKITALVLIKVFINFTCVFLGRFPPDPDPNGEKLGPGSGSA